MGSSVLLALVIGVSIGVLAAVRRGSGFDYATAIVAMIALSLPTFWFGLLAIFLFAQTLGWLPAGGIASTDGGGVLDRLWHLVLPMSVLAFVLVAQWSRYTRSAMIEILEPGLHPHGARQRPRPTAAVLLNHALRAALVPLITLAGLAAAAAGRRRAGDGDGVQLARHGPSVRQCARIRATIPS